MNKARHKVAASVKVYRVGDMKTRGRKALCGWMRKLADDLQNEPEAYAKTFRARYLYPANAEVSFRACEINSTAMFGVSVARVDGFRSQPSVNTDEDMVRVVLDMPKGTWRKLKSIIPPNAALTGAESVPSNGVEILKERKDKQ